MAKALKEKNYFGMGISDNEVLYGAPSFVKMMSSINKPYVIGEEFLVDDDNISLYVVSEEGYRNLLAINVEKQKGKLIVRPGLTGYNQAYYRNSVEQNEKFEHDLYYAEHISFWLDVKIFCKTIQTVLTHKNVYNDASTPEVSEWDKMGNFKK